MTRSLPADGLRIVFAGTPDFAAHHLQQLLDSRHQVIAVYSQPDRPAGRGKKLTASPVKQLALQNDIAVYQPLTLKTPEAQQQLAALNADIMVVVAYGLLLPAAVLEIPRLGCINVHASLLPRWRGAAPIQRAIEAGDTVTGVTIMQMDVGLDTGDMLLTTECPITPEDTGGTLHDRLLTLGGPALLSALDQLQQGTAKPEVQDDSLSCYAGKLSKEEALLDWRLAAQVLARRIRAFNPFPVAYTRLAGSAAEDRIRVLKAQVPEGSDNSGAPGQIVGLSASGVQVCCGEQTLLLQQVQLPGKKAVSVEELLRGHADYFRVGDVLESAH